MISPQVLKLANSLWNYHKMNHTLVVSDCILALGSHDPRVAERAAELYLQGWAPLLVMSGGLGNFTKEMWTEKEADKFADVAKKMGVPEKNILIENRSSNTGENIAFTKRLLEANHMDPNSFIVVQKPYMERRAYATFRKHWPDKNIVVTSPQISFEKYPTDEITVTKVIDIMVGDLQRIKLYPAKGFQVYQEIPDDVWHAYLELIELGFDGHLVKE